MTEVPPLFHWSPTTRRKGIERFGLKPGCLATDRLWRPPYVALSPDPALAWMLSGATERGVDHPSWDLWQVWLSGAAAEELRFDDDSAVKEFRVYERIYKRDVWLVATRERGS